jgi:hypothetical protein
MARFFALLSVLLLCLTPSAASGLEIALVGDSHMEGLAPYLRPALESDGHSVHVVARRGWSCRSYRRAGTYLRRRTRGADLVVLLLGANDRRTDPEVYRDDLNWILSQIDSSQVVWLGPPVASRQDVDVWHLAATRMQPALLPPTVEWVDSREDTSDLRHSRDAVHFLFHSYREWASRVLSRLEPRL